MNFNENYLWRDETELLNLRLSNLPSAKVLLKLEVDTKDQVLLLILMLLLLILLLLCCGPTCCYWSQLVVKLRLMKANVEFLWWGGVQPNYSVEVVFVVLLCCCWCWCCDNTSYSLQCVLY